MQEIEWGNIDKERLMQDQNESVYSKETNIKLFKALPYSLVMRVITL